MTQEARAQEPVSYTETLAAAIRVVERWGADRIYVGKADPDDKSADTTCYYEPKPDRFPKEDARTQSGCLAGEIMRDLKVEGFPFDSIGSIYGLLETDDRFDLPAITFLGELQAKQDAGSTWGRALADSRAYMDEEWLPNAEPDYLAYLG